VQPGDLLEDIQANAVSCGGKRKLRLDKKRFLF